MNTDRLESKTKVELLALAKQQGIHISRSLLKQEIVALVRRALAKKKPQARPKIAGKAKTAKSKSAKPQAGKPKAPKSSKAIPRQSEGAMLLPGVSAVGGEVQSAKFMVGNRRIHDEMRDRLVQDLPDDYGCNKLVLMARDAHWVYAYWEIQQDRVKEELKSLGKSSGRVRWVLRVFAAHAGDKATVMTDVEVLPDSRNWYLCLRPAGASFYAEIGLLDEQGRFRGLARSNAITLPSDRPSNVSDEQWMSSDSEFQKIYALSSGGQLGGGSEAGQRVVFGDSSWGLSRGIFFGRPEGKDE